MGRSSFASRLAFFAALAALGLILGSVWLSRMAADDPKFDPCPASDPASTESSPTTIVILVPGAVTPAPSPSQSPTPSPAPSATPNPFPCTAVDAITDKVGTAVEQGIHFKIGAIELLLIGLLALALLRVALERGARRARVVELEPYAGVDDPTKVKVGPALQRRLNEMELAPPVVLPTPSATESLGSILAETGVPPATAVGKTLKSIASLIWPKAGYVATWTAEIPKPDSTSMATATVAVREASSGAVIGAEAVSASDFEGAVDLAAGAIWSIIVNHPPIGDTIPIWRRWIGRGGATYVDYQRVMKELARSGPSADKTIELRRLKKLEPNNADIPFALAEAYTAEGDHLRAIDALRYARDISGVAIKTRYRLAAAYSFVATWLKRDRETDIRNLEKELWPTEEPRPWNALRDAFLAEAEQEFERLRADLSWFTVVWKWLRVDRAAASELRAYLGPWRGSDRGRNERLILSALYVTQLQRRRLSPRSDLDAAWLKWRVGLIEGQSWLAGDWKVDYNLVCLIAQAVGRGISRDEADRQVVERLRRMLLSPRSPADAAVLRWIACDDPDLQRLRFEGSRFCRFWAEREVEYSPAAPVPAEVALQDRFTFAAGVARWLAALWEERAAVVAGWTLPQGVALVEWLDHEQRIGWLMLDWIKDPTDERAADLAVVVGFLPGEPTEGGHLELISGWDGLGEPATTARDAMRKNYEALVTERATGKVEIAHTAAIAGTLRAARRWRLLEAWLMKPADADAKKAYSEALKVESEPPPAKASDDAEDEGDD